MCQSGGLGREGEGGNRLLGLDDVIILCSLYNQPIRLAPEVNDLSRTGERAVTRLLRERVQNRGAEDGQLSKLLIIIAGYASVLST